MTKTSTLGVFTLWVQDRWETALGFDGYLNSDEIKEDALDRLYDLFHIASNVGYGLGDDMENLLAETNLDDVRNRA